MTVELIFDGPKKAAWTIALAHGAGAGLECVEEPEPHRLLELGVALDFDIGARPELVEVSALAFEQGIPAGVLRDPDGRELADVLLRVPMKNYPVLMQSLQSLGKIENVSVQRQDRTGAQIDEASAPEE